MPNPIKIDLTQKALLNESITSQLANQIKAILRQILSIDAYHALIREEEKTQTFVIKGSKKDVMAFADTIEKEKQYAQDYMEHGLGTPQLTDSKLELEKSIHNFEKTTGIKWPVG